MRQALDIGNGAFNQAMSSLQVGIPFAILSIMNVKM
jgi:hypothetical protein